MSDGGAKEDEQESRLDHRPADLLPVARRIADPVTTLPRRPSPLDLLLPVDIVEHDALPPLLPQLVRLVPDEHEGQSDKDRRNTGDLRVSGQ